MKSETFSRRKFVKVLGAAWVGVSQAVSWTLLFGDTVAALEGKA
jgi:hypothetical protein